MIRSRNIVYTGQVGDTLVIIARDESGSGAPSVVRGRGPFAALPPGRYTVKRYLAAEPLPYLGEIHLDIQCSKAATAGSRNE